MRAMRVHEFGGLEQLTLDDVPLPEPGEGQVRVRAAAIGVNFADILMVAGEYQLKPDLPFAPGFEVAGRVDSVGPRVSGLSPGDLVTATPRYGGYAEQVVVPVPSVFPLPPTVDPIVAVATTVTYGTAYHALRDRARLGRGETLLVTGATGGVGSAAVQIGRLLGARVIAAVGSREKARAARALGADEVVVYGGSPRSLRDQLHPSTGSRRLDVVLDVVGGDVFDQCVRELAPGGRLLVVGFTSGRIPRPATNLVLLKETSIVGVFWGAFRERERERAEEELERIWGWLGSGDIVALPTATYPLPSATSALADLAARRLVGKAVLLTDEGSS